MNPAIIDRLRGMLYGLAIGDALGAAIEFKAPGTFAPVTGYRGDGPHGLNPGEWTDDTSMALALADSLSRGWDETDQMWQYVAWHRTGKFSVNGRCFDIGNQTCAALGRFEAGTPATLCGAIDERSCGNGSIMRLAPVAIRYATEGHDVVRDMSRQSSKPTHARPECLDACKLLGSALWLLSRGQSINDWITGNRLSTSTLAMQEIAAGSFMRKAPPKIRGSGYVVNSLEAALWAFHDAPDFRTAVLRAVNLGDDADTTGAVCGQLAGAYWGESGIPADLIEGLARKDMIEAALAGLGCGRRIRADQS